MLAPCVWDNVFTDDLFFFSFSFFAIDLNLVLKEQRTLIRQYKERKAKEDARKPWVHLPNRPVTTQRQHYSW